MSSDMWLISMWQQCRIDTKQRQQTLVEPILHMTNHYQILTFIDGTVGHAFCDCYDITLLTKGEGQNLLVIGRQTMNSVWTNKVVFFLVHMCEY